MSDRPLALTQRFRLQRAAVELAAQYREPLPAGDAGIIAAVDRYLRLRPMLDFRRQGFVLDTTDDEELIQDALNAASELEMAIESMKPATVSGCVAVLQFVLVEPASAGRVQMSRVVAVLEAERGYNRPREMTF